MVQKPTDIFPYAFLPVMRVMATGLCIVLGLHALWLWLHGTQHFGVQLVMLLSALGLVMTHFNTPLTRWRQKARWRHRVWQMGWLLFGLWLSSVVAFFGWISWQNHQPRGQPPVAALIVLGGGVHRGQPTATLQARVDRAAEWAHAVPNAAVIVSGGLDRNEHLTEAEVMARELVQQGIPRQRIWLEPRSTSTAENLVFSTPILLAQGLSVQQPIGLVSSDFHVMRAQLIAKRQGYAHPLVLGSPTPVSVRYYAWLREYFAYVSGWVLGEF